VLIYIAASAFAAAHLVGIGMSLLCVGVADIAERALIIAVIIQNVLSLISG
jgi:hypothetical protein